jgi:hypothetical protein
LAEWNLPGDLHGGNGKQAATLHAIREQGEQQARWRKLPITPKQEAYLRRRCQWRMGMTRGEASGVIEGVDTFGPRPLWWDGDWPPALPAT